MEGLAAVPSGATVFYGIDRRVFFGDWVVVFGGYFLVYGRGARVFSWVSAPLHIDEELASI